MGSAVSDVHTMCFVTLQKKKENITNVYSNAYHILSRLSWVLKVVSHHSLPFISTLLILFQQSNQLYAVVLTCFQLLTEIRRKIPPLRYLLNQTQIFLLERLRRQAIGLMQSWSIASRAIGQQFDIRPDRFITRKMLLSV